MYHAIEINEIDGYNIAPADKPHIKAIWETYAYDDSEATYLCELQPSYWLVYIATTVELTDEARETLAENEIDALYMRYECHGENDDHYMHCSQVEKISVEHKRSYEADNYESFTDFCDHIRCNAPF